MRSPHALVAFQLFAALALHACGCFVPVTEKQCDVNTPCGSGWVCRAGECFPPDGGTGGGSAGGIGGGGAVGGGSGGSGGGGGVGGGLGGGVGGGTGGGGGTVCGGCRDIVGQCQPGNTSARCGAGGNACTTCQVNQTCQNGACTNTGCSASTCADGCCRNGICFGTASQSAQICGIAGQTCAACPAGQGCFFGKCSAVSTCNATNCAGCCFGSFCVDPSGQSASSCGLGGKACMGCPAGQFCNNGSCSLTAPCTASNCPGGCCTGGAGVPSKCTPYSMQSASLCGTAGNLCAQCPFSNFCSGAGVCVPPVCSPANCTGCCGTNGCTTGTTTAVCGKNGNACQACGMGQTCSNGTCSAAPKKIGDACSVTSDCAAIGTSAYCKLTTSTGNGVYTNGFCTRPCSADAGTNCTVDSVCLNSLQPYGENDAFCSPRCNSMNQCRAPGYACYFINTVSTTACWLNPIPSSGTDAGFADAGTSFIGSACVNAGNCTNPTNAFCIQDVIPGLGASGFVGGYCSSQCAMAACVAGSSCQTVTGFSSGITQQVCLRDCVGPRTGQSNCRNGYVCEGTTGATVGACLPRCNNSGATCPSGTACNTMSGYCN